MVSGKQRQARYIVKQLKHIIMKAITYYSDEKFSGAKWFVGIVGIDEKGRALEIVQWCRTKAAALAFACGSYNQIMKYNAEHPTQNPIKVETRITNIAKAKTAIYGSFTNK